MEDLTGTRIGSYEIVAPLGAGGMAAVYKAYQPGMDRHIALKVLPRFFAAKPEFVQRFEREVQVIAGLQHPRILPVHDYGEADGYIYLAMSLVESGTLGDLTSKAPLPEVLKAVAAASPVPPRRMREEIPVDLEKIILRCLKKDRSRRYASAHALHGDLVRFSLPLKADGQDEGVEVVEAKVTRATERRQATMGNDFSP